jgi:hypothetical protein
LSGYQTLREENPGLVYCSITAYGGDGPYRDRPGYDMVLSAAGGLMFITGEREGNPCKVGVAITGGTFYRGTTFPQPMQGSYLFTDYCGDWIRRLDSLDTMQPFATGVSSVVDLKVGEDHALYYVTRSSGSVRRITYSVLSPPEPPTNLTVD